MRAIVVLACIAVFAAVVSGADVEADKPRKPQRLVPPTVIKRNRVMPRTNVVIVPKGDPRARAPLPLDVMPPVVAVPVALPVAPQMPVAVPVAPQVPAAVPVAPAAVPVVPAAVPAMGTNAAARDPVNAMGTNAATRDPVNAMGTNAATRDAAAAAVPAVVPPAVVPPAVVPPAVVPAAVPAQPQTPATPTPVLQSRGPLVLKSGVKNSAACAQRKGVCKASSSCSGSIVRGICPGNSSITCCVPKTAAKPSTPAKPTTTKPTTTKPTTTKPNTSKPATNTGSCPVYANAPVSNIKGNGGKMYQVVRIAAAHFSGSADNTMTKPTACAFARMAAAAAAAGIRLTINSGFRTYERQVYFWNCYQKKNCNNGNRAARPGNSNHGRGQALDINTGGTSTKTYKWMAANAARFGFRRTVSDEPWHWEH